MDLATSIDHDMFHCAICCHDLHDISWLFHANNIEWNFIQYPTNCICITNLLVSEVSNDFIAQNMLQPISPFLDEGMGEASPLLQFDMALNDTEP